MEKKKKTRARDYRNTQLNVINVENLKKRKVLCENVFIITLSVKVIVKIIAIVTIIMYLNVSL